jgi:transcriptional regulator with XRE-family HTH domain
MATGKPDRRIDDTDRAVPPARRRRALKHDAPANSSLVNGPLKPITPELPTEIPSAAEFVSDVRSSFGVTREFFARMTGFSARTISGWEAGRPVSEAALRRMEEMKRLRDALADGIQAEFIARWLETPCEGLGGLKPVEILERGETDRLWRTVLLIGSGMPT